MQNDFMEKKWFKESVFAEARKYQTKKDFERGCGSAYNAAIKNGWIKEMDWFKEIRKPSNYWTKERVFAEAKKYQTRGEFARGCHSAYNAARENGWLEEMEWFKEKHKPKGYWEIKKNVFKEARKYETKNEFKKGCPLAYRSSYKNKWLDEMDWFEDGNIKKLTDKIDCVYIYPFKETNSLYVGRTICPNDRDWEHRTDKRYGKENTDTVYRYAKENGFEIPKMEIIEDNLSVIEGQEREGYWVEYYREKGYNILNKIKTGKGSGSIGAIGRGKWTKEKVFEEARKYISKRKFQECCAGAFDAAYRKGWFSEMDWFVNCRKYKKVS